MSYDQDPAELCPDCRTDTDQHAPECMIHALTTLTQERDNLLAALEAVEWSYINHMRDHLLHCCPTCYGPKPHHKKDCTLNAALRAARGEVSE